MQAEFSHQCISVLCSYLRIHSFLICPLLKTKCQAECNSGFHWYCLITVNGKWLLASLQLQSHTLHEYSLKEQDYSWKVSIEKRSYKNQNTQVKFQCHHQHNYHGNFVTVFLKYSSLFLFQLKLFCFLKAQFLGDMKHLAGRPSGAEGEELKVIYSELLDYFCTRNNSQWSKDI